MIQMCTLEEIQSEPLEILKLNLEWLHPHF